MGGFSVGNHGERQLQRQDLFPRRTRRATENGNIKTFIHEGPRRRSRATPFCPRRGAKNGNCNFFCPRRARSMATATAKPFSTEDTEGHGERQHQDLYPRRAAKGHEGPRRKSRATSFVHEGPRRRSRATPFCPRRTRRAAKNGFCTFLSWVGWAGCGGRVVWDVALRAFYLTFGRDSYIVMVLPARCGRGRYSLGL